MKILHTADWHIGQMFYNYDRHYEHEIFLSWLLDTIGKEAVDVVLISGDVFDVSNPSAASIRTFYSFLNQAISRYPDLHIIITAGNHDSASRLEAPVPLLETRNIRIVGLIPRTAEGEINYQELLFPVTHKQSGMQIWIMAIPFLRVGDYPVVPDASNTYSAGVSGFYQQAYNALQQLREAHHHVIAMGHLHAMDCAIYDKDSHDREIMGGVECIPLSAFHENIHYVALGHIHRAQKVGGKEGVRYCGSPVPLSFSEANYNHQVLLLEFSDKGLEETRSIPVPVVVPLLKLPAKPGTLADILTAIASLDEAAGKDMRVAPYLEIHVLMDGPEPSLRFQVEEALKGKFARLARIVSSRKENETGPDTVKPVEQLSPQGIFEKIFEREYQADLPDELLHLFLEVKHAVETQDASE